jgi:hypothetical protein
VPPSFAPPIIGTTAFNAVEGWLVLRDTIADSDMACLVQSYPAFSDAVNFGITAGASSCTSFMSFPRGHRRRGYCHQGWQAPAPRIRAIAFGLVAASVAAGPLVRGSGRKTSKQESTQIFTEKKI